MTSAKNKIEGPEDIFQELYDSILEEAEGKTSKRKQHYQDKIESSHDAIDFLENEYHRLGKLNSFFTTKINNLQKHDQISYLIRHQKNSISKIYEELIPKLVKEEGHFGKQLSYLWDKTFG